MTLQQLHYVIEISEQGSMNKAAEALYVSQPSLTSAVRELEKLSLSDSYELREKSRRAMGLISHMLQYHVLAVTGDAEDPRINDVQIIEYVMRYRGSKRIAVITQDYQLAKDLQTINRLRSYSGSSVQLYKLNSDNRLYRRIIMD